MAELVTICDWYYQMTMKEIGAAEFKAHFLSILDEVEADDGLVITKRGKPVAKLIPIRAESSALIGALAGEAGDRW